MTKHNILVMGAGKIGATVATLLNSSDDYKVFLSDVVQPFSLPIIKENPIEFIALNINAPDEIKKLINKEQIKAVISCLPFNLTILVAKIAHQCGVHYFDPTEDVATTNAVTRLARDSKAAFAPQCGLAPGFISIAANSLMQDMEEINTVKMRVGALTQSTSNSLKYGFTWSIDGLINEYIHPCAVIINGQKEDMPALGELETIIIDNNELEAFHTSGGVGSLANTYLGKVKNLDYKTIRFPGHCDKMKFLLNDLNLREDPELLKSILSKVIPHVEDDKVIVYVSVSGIIKGRLIEKTYTNTLYPTTYFGHQFSAIQMTTAAGICTVVDLVIKEKKLTGLVKQEQITLDQFLSNRFGKYYAISK
ncbi:MAG: hypothetical protein K0R49_644 [Burkholderiales bacterium]|jgi:saccharopine dehydrogenase-like NADP-dependent oxidoreductase|nr:hypothetical protein [Burkholderiales bacterium]MCE3268392.1 hypothetical protein [Burkholderiales bacterium]